MRIDAGDTTVTKLSDTQLAVLSVAAQRPDRLVLPLPERLKGGAAVKVIDSLIAKGLVEETEELIGEADRGPVLDAGLIGCAQAVEHYEIARYGTLCAWAEQLKMDEAVTLLEETLEEEEATDEKLSQLALAGINESADAGNDEDDDDEKEDKPAQRKRKAN